MSRMRQTVTHSSTHTTNHQDHESNLDALLEDLQTTVSRSNSQLNLNGGTMTTGYREVRRTVTDGTPHGTMSEYQIEYLNPANSTHHMIESGHHNGLQNQRNASSSYKDYNYATSERSGRNDAKLKQNISELDSLLDDLNTAQKKNFSESTVVTRNVSGIDSGLLEPVQTSTPHNRIVEQKHYREERVSRGRSSSPRRELVFTGPRSRDPSPISRDYQWEQGPPAVRQQQWDQGSPGVRQQQVYRYEKTTSTRTTGPGYVQDINSPVDSVQTLRNNLAIEDSTLRGRSPSPGINRIEYHYANTTTSNRDATPLYSNEKVTTYRDQDTNREYSPQRYTSGKTTNSYSYNSSSKEVHSSEVPRSPPPPPHRSPSPVSFQQPPLPGAPKRGPYSYDSQPPQSPQLPQKFTPSDPSHNRLTYTVSQQPQTTVSTYKYSTTTSNNYNVNHSGYPGEEAPLLPRPFPTPSPTPEQQPPKKLDDLMATFSDGQGTELRNRHNTTTTTIHRYDSDRSNQALIPNGGYDREKEREKERIIEKEKAIVKKEESKNVEGPPVYYPPGVELFSKKEEAMSQQQSAGGMYKAKAKYEYEAKSKTKHKESSGKAVVPVCLPVCCAMPCTIM